MLQIIKIVVSCVVKSLRQRRGVITCEMVNPGAVNSSALPWLVAGGIFVIGFIGLFAGEILKLPQCTQVSGHVVTGSFTYLLGRGQAILERKKLE